MRDPGTRPYLVRFERATYTRDSYGTKIPSWALFTSAWASVKWGSGQERREAAQEKASQVATFEFDWSTKLSGVTVMDKMIVFGRTWDISGIVTIGPNAEIHITSGADMDQA